MTFSLIMMTFLETTDEDYRNVNVKWQMKHFVKLCGGPQQVGGDSTHFGPLRI